VVVYSRFDLGNGWEQFPHAYSHGLKDDDALKDRHERNRLRDDALAPPLARLRRGAGGEGTLAIGAQVRPVLQTPCESSRFPRRQNVLDRLDATRQRWWLFTLLSTATLPSPPRSALMAFMLATPWCGSVRDATGLFPRLAGGVGVTACSCAGGWSRSA